nr:hypothetical protein [Cupriavidus gilardii]
MKPNLPVEDDSHALIHALAEMAALCGQSLEAASVGAADPQLRALLLHRGSLQQRAANDLVARVPPRPRGAAPRGVLPSSPATRDRPGDSPLQAASRRASRCVSASAAILRSDVADPMQRSLLIRYYHETSDLLRVLEQLTREHDPVSRRPPPRPPVGRTQHHR